jgi:hypothetical protein
VRAHRVAVIGKPDSSYPYSGHIFSGCTNLTSIEVDPNNPTYYSQNNCVIDRATKQLVIGISTSHIPEDVASIGDYAFHFCYSLTSLTVPDGVTHIGVGAFRGCGNLTSVTIPPNVTEIKKETFVGCRNLSSFHIPKNVTSIGASAFYGCSSLTSIIIPRSVTSIGESAFTACQNLIICCEQPKRPKQEVFYWNPSECPIIWNYKDIRPDHNTQDGQTIKCKERKCSFVTIQQRFAIFRKRRRLLRRRRMRFL